MQIAFRCFLHRKGRRVGCAQSAFRPHPAASRAAAPKAVTIPSARAAEAAERQQASSCASTELPGRGGAGRAMPTAPLVHGARRAASAGAAARSSSRPGLAASAFSGVGACPSPPGCCPSLECSGARNSSGGRAESSVAAGKPLWPGGPASPHPLAAVWRARLLGHRGSPAVALAAAGGSVHRGLECK